MHTQLGATNSEALQCAPTYWQLEGDEASYAPCRAAFILHKLEATKGGLDSLHRKAYEVGSVTRRRGSHEKQILHVEEDGNAWHL